MGERWVPNLESLGSSLSHSGLLLEVHVLAPYALYIPALIAPTSLKA